MLFRKRGTAPSILAIALLVAILASMGSITNHINSEAEALKELVNIGETYIFLSKQSSSITSSQIDANLAGVLKTVPGVNHVLPQKIFKANMTVKSNEKAILLRAIADPDLFFDLRGGSLDGAKAKARGEACVGEILARMVGINLGDQVNLTINDVTIEVRVVGIFRTMTQSDSELVVPMEAAHNLTGSEGKVSMIEFTLEVDAMKDPIQNIYKLLPGDVEVMQVQQPGKFIQDINAQTLFFLNNWSLAVYAVVVAASHIVAARLTSESTYELAMLRALGTRKRHIFTLILTYMVTVATIGSILGVALGIAGAQTASTVAGWMLTSLNLAPFMELDQALELIILTQASSIVGSIFAAFKAAGKTFEELIL